VKCSVITDFIFAISVFSIFLFAGCDRAPSHEVVLYTSVDEPIASPIVRDFEKQTGIHVRLVTDTEASKSVGLAERLRAEKSNPQADVWWGNEPFYTIQLGEEGLFQPYESQSSAQINPMYQDPQHRWAGNGLRMRVIAAVGVEGSNEFPTSIEDLAAPGSKFRLAMATPTAGTTGGHVAALYFLWGNDRADAFFRALRANGIKLLGGNSNVAEAVARGTIDFGLTDNDDVNEAKQFVIDPNHSLQAIAPDQTGIGTLMIPTTVGIVAGTQHLDDAKQLADFLLSMQVEKKLLERKFIVESVRGNPNVKPMQIDYSAVAKMMPQAIRRATAIL